MSSGFISSTYSSSSVYLPESNSIGFFHLEAGIEREQERQPNVSIEFQGCWFFFFNIIIILEKATFIILISFHFLNIPRNQTEYKRFYIGNFNEQHYKTLKPNLATETAAT